MNKKIVVISGICVVLVCLFISGFISKKERKTYDIDASLVNSIVVNEKVNDVKVKISDDDKIHVTYSEGKNLGYKIEKNGDKLSIATSSKFINFTIGIDTSDNSLIIKIPKDYKKDLKVITEQECSVDKLIQFNSLNIVKQGNDD